MNFSTRLQSLSAWSLQLLCIFSVSIGSQSLAACFDADAHYHVCFTPYQNCTAQITAALLQARHQIHLQAYSFTSKPIINALKVASSRGVKVRVILDKSHLAQPELARTLVRHRIPVWIDRAAGIAHNKVIIIDQSKVITGSFNFSYAAQYRNAENVLLIQDAKLAQLYLNNWYQRYAEASPFLADTTSALESLDGWHLWELIKQWLLKLLLDWSTGKL